LFFKSQDAVDGSISNPDPSGGTGFFILAFYPAVGNEEVAIDCLSTGKTTFEGKK